MTTTADLQAQLESKKAQLAAANTTYLSLLNKDHKEYRFDSGEGTQQVKRLSLTEVKEQIDSLEADIRRLEGRLRRRGLTSVVVRRRGRTYY